MDDLLKAKIAITIAMTGCPGKQPNRACSVD
jgi:hypothetical protein